MSFLNSSLAFALAVAFEAVQLPTFTGTDADATRGSIYSRRSSLPLTFADFKTEIRLLIGKGYRDEFE